ncbi:helix-turn-helix domain-containing protein [Azospirillum sp. ST 5-10]|uniref:helix-turn-helix domain-containing protein n=1 Tax=unclassified Azospirillum TaxID=2630922 RepID=UPI003F49C22D
MTGDEFRRWRDRHRMTQAQAAALHAVTERTVRTWETAAPDHRAAVLCAAWDLMRPEQRKRLFAWSGRQGATK